MQTGSSEPVGVVMREISALTSQNAQQFPTGYGPVILRRASIYLPVNVVFVTGVLEFVTKHSGRYEA